MSKYKAEFSHDRKHRYFWSDTWDSRPPLVVIGLNPSTANENQTDPTIARCVSFAVRWGHGALWMLNLFAFRATNPIRMRMQEDPVGPQNNSILLERCRTGSAIKGGRVLCAWGNHGTYRNRSLEVLRMLRADGIRLECLKLTKAGQPWHPLYMRGDTVPFEYEWGK